MQNHYSPKIIWVILGVAVGPLFITILTLFYFEENIIAYAEINAAAHARIEAAAILANQENQDSLKAEAISQLNRDVILGCGIIGMGILISFLINK